MTVSWDSDSNVDASTDESPDETWNTLGFAGKKLEGEGDGVNVWAVVGDNGESKDDEAEFAECAQAWDHDCGKKTANS